VLLAAALGVASAKAMADGGTYASPELWAAGTLVAGWSFVAAGLFTWTREPGNPGGRIVTLAGFCTLASGFTGSDDELLFDVGVAAGGLMLATIAHLLLVFPSGRASGPLTRALIAAPYIITVPVLLPLLPELGPEDFECAGCPRISPLADTGDALVDAITLAQGIASTAIAVGIALIVGRRHARASPRMRHAFGPVLATGAVLATLLTIGFAGAVAGSPIADVFVPAGYLAIGAVPFAYLAGLARARLANASALVVENRRLDAELQARLEDLRASRVRLVNAGDEARRRIERDLHDGAQQRFVALALSLRLARMKVDDGSEAGALLDAAQEELAAGLRELRELARGIHPAVLTERGLVAAVQSLVSHCAIPVIVGDLPERRWRPEIEAAAYFVVAEALTNVIRYSGAAEARVEIFERDGHLCVEVADDGAGGARADGGSGLRGLADRVAALDGRFGVRSPPGGGTCVTAQLPL
jgi:signal transduction histidine kinase